MSLNKVILLGRLGKDPEVRYAQSGTTVATLNLATDERRPDGNGGWKKHTEWHRVVLFGKTADAAKNHLAKGREVLIEGSLSTRQWQGQDGVKKYTTEVVCQNMRFVGNKPSGNGAPAAATRNAAPAQRDSFAEDFADSKDDFGADPDADIPF